MPQVEVGTGRVEQRPRPTVPKKKKSRARHGSEIFFCARHGPRPILGWAVLGTACQAMSSIKSQAILPPPILPPSSHLFPTSSPPVTIPAFPEQSDVVGAACPLDLPDDLLPAISAACSTFASGRLSSCSRCCPALAAWLYATYFATTLVAHPLPAPPSLDLPILSDDSEACVGGVKRALHNRSVCLPRVNDTCDAMYCYYSICLRRLTCVGGASGTDERWVPLGDVSRRLERDCSLLGLSGCSRCLSGHASPGSSWAVSSLVRGPKFSSPIWYGLMGHAWHGLVL